MCDNHVTSNHIKTNNTHAAVSLQHRICRLAFSCSVEDDHECLLWTKYNFYYILCHRSSYFLNQLGYQILPSPVRLPDVNLGRIFAEMSNEYVSIFTGQYAFMVKSTTPSLLYPVAARLLARTPPHTRAQGTHDECFPSAKQGGIRVRIMCDHSICTTQALSLLVDDEIWITRSKLPHHCMKSHESYLFHAPPDFRH